MNKRDRNVQLFEESRQLWESNDGLQKQLLQCFREQKFVGAEETLAFTPLQDGTPADVIVSRRRTLEAAEGYVRKGRKTCVLNLPLPLPPVEASSVALPHRKNVSAAVAPCIPV